MKSPFPPVRRVGMVCAALSVSMAGQSIKPGSPPPLRLVFPDQGLSLAQARARREVEEANRQAATFAQDNHTPDVRRALASRIAESLEGGRAAILPVERRRELVSAAGRLGIRPFEANLVIALVQDAARRGEPTVGGGPLDRMLGVIPQPATDSRRVDRWAWFRAGLATMALGGLLMTFLVHWILGGAK